MVEQKDDQEHKHAKPQGQIDLQVAYGEDVAEQVAEQIDIESLRNAGQDDTRCHPYGRDDTDGGITVDPRPLGQPQDEVGSDQQNRDRNGKGIEP